MAYQYMPKIFHDPHKDSLHLLPSYILNVWSLKLIWSNFLKTKCVLFHQINLMDVKQGLKKPNLEENIQMNDPYPNDSYPSMCLAPSESRCRTFKNGKQ